MDPQTYMFTDRWLVPAERDRVYAVLEDVGGYPGWWPQVKTVERVDDGTAAVTCRSVLPYTLRFRMAAARQSPDTGVLEATLRGDLVGTCRWELTRVDGGTRVEFAQVVTTPGRMLRLAGRVVRPLLVLNHRLMMRQARRGLTLRMAS
jgi:hypothetical protein